MGGEPNIGYDRLLDWLTRRFTLDLPDPRNPGRPANLLPFAYDWRLSNRFNARRLKTVVEPALERWCASGAQRKDARLILIGHSMGGLVARWYLEREGGAALTRKLITIGTPHRGAVAAARRLVNGVEVGIGPLRLDLTRFARSPPSAHQLLPQYACLETADGLRPITAMRLPGVDPGLLADGAAFHAELDATPALGAGPVDGAHSYDLHPIVGTRQPTPTTARLEGERIVTSDAIDGVLEGGDGTVPRLSAAPKALRPDDPRLRYAADQHLGLHSHPAVLDELEGVLTARPVVRRGGAGVEIGLRTEPLLPLGHPLAVWASVAGAEPVGLMAELVEEGGTVVERRKMRLEGAGQGCVLRPPGAGVWRVRVGPAGEGSGRWGLTETVSAISVVWPGEEGA